jgi:peptide-methionine (S)-S-oxide reductase
MTLHLAYKTRRSLLWGGAVALATLGFALSGPLFAAEAVAKIPPPGADLVTEASGPREIAVFAGGCFWGVQGVFQHTRGVIQAVSGYAGGAKQTAAYELVGSSLTGHAEAVQVSFDPKQITYAQLLQIFFSVVHDPTQMNRQGPDRGTQYRSAVFTTSPSQQAVAEKYIARLEAAKVFQARIVTQVVPLPAFYVAEGYHQDYATLHPESGYIATFDLPKIANLKTAFPQWYREQPALVAGRTAATSP